MIAVITKPKRKNESEGAMTIRLTEQLEDLRSTLARDLAEVERIGEHLAELGARLQQEPRQWIVEWTEHATHDWTRSLEPELLEALDGRRLAWLLEDIRILRRREVELRRLAVA
jgi:hypothetical protein